jgi:hypothetical protein
MKKNSRNQTSHTSLPETPDQNSQTSTQLENNQFLNTVAKKVSSFNNSINYYERRSTIQQIPMYDYVANSIERNKITNRLMVIDSLKPSIKTLKHILIILIPLQVYSFIESMRMLSFYDLNKDNQNNELLINYETFNYLMIAAHIGVYIIGLLSKAKYFRIMTVFEYLCLGLICTDAVYFVWFTFINASFMIWMMNLFYIFADICIFKETRKLRKLLEEEDLLKTKLKLLSLDL